ncbi:helicase-associated domain-containing protein [Streptomyces sp. WMMB 322]|uniref:helicase-associated domain-containing protein n=1 Tax=Streptomyces sp. WMMB 322 TaxID=1286821 RepID=UPI0006E1CF9F|nr:helicase-associated domain-containing protein [Streptomyces sp. WMMB 322]SCK07121.1 Helicase conserved C-terminal domain-containing protein [Streptomyces sp. WMMB 322]
MSTEHSGAGSAAPRTLADDLRARDDAALAELLRSRPDLLSPVPNDLTQLATRAGTRASVVRAVERLDRFALQTAEAIAVAPDPCSYATLRALLTGDPATGEAGADPEDIAAELPRALRTLREQALLWGGDDRLHLVRTARELLTPSPSVPSPTGLGPTLAEATSGMSPGRLQDILAATGLPATHDPVSALAGLTSLFADRERTDALLDGAPPESLAMLDKLRWGPPYGSVHTDSPSGPVRWLLDRALLVRTAPRTVVLPREVALSLRAGRAHRHVEPLAPPLEVRREHPPQATDETAAGQALAALDTLEDLLSGWETDPPSVLRAGGLGVRDLKRTATSLDVPEPTAAFWIELAYAAGLLAPDGEPDEAYAPTPAYDEWLRRPAHERWSRIVVSWLTGTRVPGLVGTRDAKGRALAALGQGLDRGLAADVRRRTLGLLASLHAGSAPAQYSVLARLRWERPLRGAGRAAGESAGDLRTQLAEWALHEAELLGLTGRGALASYARELVLPWLEAPPAAAGGGTPTAGELESAAARAAAGLAPLLPEPLDHMLLQADLTAVAPGPLQRPLAAMLGVLADVESKGGATVYRFTPASVRRALDAGRTASDIHAFLAAHSRTPVPQPLSYLVDDVARRHGRLRVGAASSYVRCDDDALLTEITADRRSAPLQLRLLAPTVLASSLPPDQLLAKLREMGYAPAAESAEGDVVIARADARRTPPRTPPDPVPDGPPVPDAALLTAAVRAIRAGDHAATAKHRAPKPSGRVPKPPGAGGGALPRTTSADTIAMMRSAAKSGDAVWIGYVNADGAASQRVIAPVRVEGGFVTAYDHTADEIRTYPLHRITGAAELAGP